MRHARPILFILFFISGFCGLLYQVIWLRLAFAAFGVITPVVSVILSVFMLGLSLGSWLGGRYIERVSMKASVSPIVFYSVIEALIGLGSFAVPHSFAWGEKVLLSLGESASAPYLVASAGLIAISLLPWCTLMGGTFPTVVAFVKRLVPQSESSFSFLYLANVLGAVSGTLITAMVLVEWLGFTTSLRVAATGNFLVATVAMILAISHKQRRKDSPTPVPLMANRGDVAEPGCLSRRPPAQFIALTLFLTGFCTMAMEVVWTRAFTPVMQTTIYAFAILLSVYLASTVAGSYIYRRRLGRNQYWQVRWVLGVATLTALLPLFAADPRLAPTVWRIMLSLFPFCAALGYLMPCLVDQYSLGSPRKAGEIYAINILGCILGPLVAGYILLPAIGVKGSLILLSLPFPVLLWILLDRKKVMWGIASAAVFAASLVTTTFENPMLYSNARVRRDHTATVVAHEGNNMKHLLVNGIGITIQTPITKIMAHLPLATLSRQPKTALVICFGMGTTFRSAMSWGILTTAVELVPSVKEVFTYFFADAAQIMASGRGVVIVDDGRRFLKRSTEKFDVIAIDPPPPVEAAGSSLLYSEQFYKLLKSRLADDGILQQWFPMGEKETLSAVARALMNSFPYVLILSSVEDWGYHFLASNSPIVLPTPEEMLARMPIKARHDLMEWFPGQSIEDILSEILDRSVEPSVILGESSSLTITDDRPFNEYYFIRRTVNKLTGRHDGRTEQ